MAEKEEKVLDYNALGMATDTTFGRSSTPKGASQSVKFKMLGKDLLEARYMTIVNLVNDKEMFDLRKKYTEEADDIIESALKNIKSIYKEITEETIKFKQVKEDDSFDIINLNIYNGRRTAYFRRTLVFEMS